jgi:anhydro-N-acetylmuramic acid kinase
MEELLQLCHKKERLVIGLMSGTSLDGIDIVLIKIQGSGTDVKFDILAFETAEIPATTKNQIKQCFEGNTENICKLNYDLGHLYADKILQFLNKCAFKPEQIDLIGSHGQTIYHCHQHSTLQIGEPEIIAQKTNTIVISNFRAADIAVGGSGAPLIPYLDYILFHNAKQKTALQNLGGIGNVTFISGSNPENIIAFDTGPANTILNELTEIISNGTKSFDENGVYSNQGEVNSKLLGFLMAHPYFKASLPKSTGREQFGKPYVLDILKKFPKLKQVDVLRTFVNFIATSIWLGYQQHLPEVEQIYCSGGGAKHPLILDDLRTLFKDKVKIFDSIKGISSDAKEAVAFAILANEKVNGTHTNIPSVTGATRKVSLGVISIPD